MARATSLILATTLAGLASPVAAHLCASATTYPNVACPALPQAACIVTPGCLYNGTSAYGGVCSGGALCTWQVIPDVCSSLLTCSWVPATQQLTGTTQCTGDGTVFENALCKLYDETSCVVTPGCNWLGANVFGGWCSNGVQCTYDPNPVGCAFTPGCSWAPSAVGAVPVPTLPDPTVPGGRCSGSGAAFENLACGLYDETTCMFTPGCNWGGQTSYNGWCTGGPQCTYLPSDYTCGVTPGCGWTAAPAPSTAPPLSSAAAAPAALSSVQVSAPASEDLVQASRDSASNSNLSLLDADALAASAGAFCFGRSTGWFCMGRTRVRCCRDNRRGMVQCGSVTSYHGCR